MIKLPKKRRYIGEFNRPRWDNIPACIRRLEKAGISVERLRHKTSLAMMRPATMSWSTFTAAINSILDPNIGSVMLFSQSTGNAFRCNNRGNRPGRFLSI